MKRKLTPLAMLLIALSFAGCVTTPKIGKDVTMGKDGIFISTSTGVRYTGYAVVPRPKKNERPFQRCGNEPAILRIADGICTASKYSRSPLAKWIVEPAVAESENRN